MGQDKQEAYIFPNGYFLCLSLVPMPFFALRHGNFVHTIDQQYRACWP